MPQSRLGFRRRLGFIGFTASLVSVMAAAAPAVDITNAWLRLPPPGASVAALYLNLHNASGRSQQVTGVTVAGAARSEIHRSSIGSDGSARMQPVASIPLAPGETLSFTPGGLHVMAYGLPALGPGVHLKISVALAGGDKLAGDAVVLAQ